MSTHIMNQPSRRLPSIDWIALGIGVLGLVLSRIQIPGGSNWVGLIGLAVFGPPLLRELGWLKDDDEYSRNIRWRAGFHAVLAVGLLIFLNKLLFPLIQSHPDAATGKYTFFPNETMRQYLVVAFLFSYLIQYWGPPLGVFRILLGVAGMTLLEGFLVIVIQRNHPEVYSLVILGIVALLVGMAFFTRWKPRIGGIVLLLLGVSSMVILVRDFLTLPPDAEMYDGLAVRMGFVKIGAQSLLVFGVTSLSLLLGNRDEND
jgi:hypothetical protein